MQEGNAADRLKRERDGTVRSDDGWLVRFLHPDLIEYCTGRAACLVNVSHARAGSSRQIYASESSSDLFPHLREHLAAALQMFHGQYVLV